MITAELDKIIEEAPAKIQELLGELHANILQAAGVALAESQESETGKATLSVSMSLKINLACSPVAWNVEAAVAVRHKVASESEVADTSPELAPDMGKGRRSK
ncbi:hypothetical protein [Prosthecobacter sp.]|jgi:hypothetical protein|uniref:hypothetical protein n=1 Tax=Prosthecobacter sp. TaxID=1965333 RepID=UPI0037CA490A